MDSVGCCGSVVCATVALLDDETRTQAAARWSLGLIPSLKAQRKRGREQMQEWETESTTSSEKKFINIYIYIYIYIFNDHTHNDDDKVPPTNHQPLSNKNWPATGEASKQSKLVVEPTQTHTTRSCHGRRQQQTSLLPFLFCQRLPVRTTSPLPRPLLSSSLRHL